MAGPLPDGVPVPVDGSLPEAAMAENAGQPLSVYVHVPYCRTRCGYCDFNTYTASELGADPGAAQDSYVAATLAELDVARRVVGERTVRTVFVGGGTPTLLPAGELASIIRRIDDTFGLAPDAEVTTEANPESVTPESLATLREAGFTRISFGMQSAVPHVLATLDRTHTPGRALDAVNEARAAGFDDVSLDLIYGTPGESLEDWRTSLDQALSAEPDHVSAYALIVEEGTPLARQVRRGEIAMPDDDDLADKYELADDLLSAAGLSWYEVSNWSKPGHECRHNIAYWQSADWWGIGPGAHSHVGGVRWWNVKHPATYTKRLADGVSPGHGRELLDSETRHMERVLLEVRLASGLPLAALEPYGTSALPDLKSRGLITLTDDRLTLTRPGRLLADAVVRNLLD